MVGSIYDDYDGHVVAGSIYVYAVPEPGALLMALAAALLHPGKSTSIITWIMASTETIQFQATPGFRQQIEGEAAKLNLSLSAYVLYLHARLSPGCDSPRLDRHVREVFGKHGQLMRRLAK